MYQKPFSLTKPSGALRLTGLFIALLLLYANGADSSPAEVDAYQPTNGEFSTIGKAVVALLQTRDTTAFAKNLSISPEDWHSIITTNMSKAQSERLNAYAEGADHNIQRLASSAKAFLKLADSLHLDFGNNPHFQIIPPKYVGEVYFYDLGVGDQKASQPYVQKLEVILAPGAGANLPTDGEFELVIRGLQKFPGGWRVNDGMQWEAFPSNVADNDTLRKLAILDKAANYQGINSHDDPTLLKLGEALVRFIQNKDVTIYQKDALLNGDLLWAQLQRNNRDGGPSRTEFDREMSIRMQQDRQIAQAVLRQMDDAGVDFKDAKIQIKDASVEHCQARGAPGSLNGLTGDQFRLTLAVKADGVSRTGASLSGDYVLAANEIREFGNSWRIMEDIHWYQFPTGVVDAATEEKLKFENYVAEYRAMPPGTLAPDIAFITLDGEKRMKLSDLRGKVVVLDFWATWCGPCQQPMADLQKIREGHPIWGDKVAIIPLSIDDTIDQVRQHVDKRGWTNTFNAWAGDGGWRSVPAKTFRVTGVPTTYVIDPNGKIVIAGHPMGLPIAKTVDGLIAQSSH